MKHLLLALTVAFMACNDNEEQSNPYQSLDDRDNAIMNLMHARDSTWEDNGELVYRAKGARDIEDTIHLYKLSCCITDSIDWLQISITNEEVIINRFIDDREWRFIKDSVNRRGINPNINIDVRMYLKPGARYFKTKSPH